MSTSRKKKSAQIFPEFLDIMGTPWEISVRDYCDDPYFKEFNASGYCSNPEKLIVLCDAKTDPEKEREDEYFLKENMKTCLRHEIVHAFLYESGLGESATRPHEAWSVHEEMVDWIAQQTPKIYKTFEKAGCLHAMKPDTWMRWREFEKDEKNE